MYVENFICNPFSENTYVVYDDTLEALIIDPGFYNEEEFLQAKNFLKENDLTLKCVLNTHLHLDHCIGNGFLKQAFEIQAKASEKDLPLLKNVALQAKAFGLKIEMPIPLDVQFIHKKDTLYVGNMEFTVLEVPGHSAGGLAFYEKRENVVFVGDTLFKGSFGRTDLPSGDFFALKTSILDCLFKLPENTVVFSGHGMSSTIGQEKRSNEILYGF